MHVPFSAFFSMKRPDPGAVSPELPESPGFPPGLPSGVPPVAPPEPPEPVPSSAPFPESALPPAAGSRSAARSLSPGDRDAALLVHSTRADRIGMDQGQELRDAQEARVSGFALWLQPRIDAGEVAPLPAPLLESLILGPVVGVARRWLAGYDDTDLEEAARLLPDRIWLAVGSGPGAPRA